MDATLIKQRIAALQNERAKALLRQVEAQRIVDEAREAVATINGAIQDCEFWQQQAEQKSLTVKPQCKNTVRASTSDVVKLEETNGVAENHVGRKAVGE